MKIILKGQRMNLLWCIIKHFKSHGNWEYLLHSTGKENKLLIMENFSGNDSFMEYHIGHLSIGVVYNPLCEQFDNYVPTILPLRYDAFIYLDEKNALHPLHIEPD